LVIRVAVLTRSPALRAGLRAILGGDPDLTVVAESGGLEEFDAPPGEVDVLVLASVAGRQVAALASAAAVLLLTDRPEEAQALARSASVWGVLPLGVSEEEFLAAIHALGEGLWVGSPALVRDLLKQPARQTLAGNGAVIETVTEREMEVLQLIARGLPNKQIALALGISDHTVKFHLSALYAKLGATNRTEAVHIGTQQGLIVL
jgi:DNA-binding NarL/FixJ family response regulator